ncbi:MAG: flagellar basal-body MS-ring/collar protein FliF [Pseudomonadota bacterium]
MDNIITFVRTVGPGRIGAMAAVSVLLVGFFALVIGRVATPSMSVLYSDLSTQDASAIVRELAAQNIPHALTGDGTTITVPEANIASARMSLAEIGLPAGGSLGYEIFDQAQSFGTSSFLQNVNHLRAMEGELSRTISSLRNVAQARVHLAIPERQLFVREQREPTASIVLKVRGQIEKSETRAIQHLVSSAVEGLKPSRVSIVDETGRLLASGSGDGDGEDGIGTALLDEREQRMEGRLRDQVNEIVSSIVGPGRARVQMSVDLDYNRVTQTSDTFDPDGQVVRSTQSRTENNAINQPANNGGVTAANQLPNGGAAAGGGQDNELSERNEETINYEISKTSRTQITEAGAVSRLSVAVLVDGRYTPDGNGGFTYAPRDEGELAQIAALVRSAVGFNADRGDTVEVVNLRFHQSPDAALLAEAGEVGMLGLQKADMFQIAEWVVLFLMTAIVSLVAIRPLIRRVIEPEQAPLLTSQEMALQAEAAAMKEQEVANQQIADAVKDGELQAETMAQVGALIAEKPAQASSIVRSWAAEAA